MHAVVRRGVALLHKWSRRRYVCQSRCVSNKPERRYRLRNWPDYNSALPRRGSLTIRAEQGVASKWRAAAAAARRGRRRPYSDLALACALTPGEVSGPPLRAAPGPARPVLLLLGAEAAAPHHPTLPRRAASLEVKLTRLGGGPLQLTVGSAGVELYGEGEWGVRLRGKEGRRTWRKPHLVIGHATHEAVAPGMTDKEVVLQKIFWLQLGFCCKNRLSVIIRPSRSSSKSY